MQNESNQRTKGLVLFAYVLAFIAPITAPLFAWALAREGDYRNANGVVALAIAWTLFVAFVIL